MTADAGVGGETSIATASDRGGEQQQPAISPPWWMVLALSSLLMLAFVARFHGIVEDDAYICFRYARNLNAGHGLVFNPGERVEGFTTFSWVMVAAGLMAAGLDPERGARAIGLLSALAILIAVVRHSPRRAGARAAIWLAPLLVALCPPLAFWTTSGLETVFFTALVTWMVVLRLEEQRWPVVVGSALLAGVAGLTRPEGVGVALLVGVVATLHFRREREGRRRLVVWWAIVLGIVVPYVVWCTIYYGSPIPNTFYAKVGHEPAQVLRGVRYVLRYLGESRWLLVFPACGLLVARRSWRLLLLGLVCVSYLAYVVAVGGDGLPVYRFLVPVLPLAFLLLADGAVEMLERATSATRPAILALLLAAVIGAALPAWRGFAAEQALRARGEVATWREVGHFFAAVGRPADSVAVIPAGAIPYFSGLKAVDMLGLNDPVIAHRHVRGLGRGHAGHEKYDVAHVLSLRPSFIVVGVYALARNPVDPSRLVLPFYTAERELLRSAEFQRDYRIRLGRTPRGYFPFFERVDRAAG